MKKKRCMASTQQSTPSPTSKKRKKNNSSREGNVGIGGRCRLGGRAVRRSRKKKPDAGDEARGKPAVGWRLASGARWSPRKM